MARTVLTYGGLNLNDGVVYSLLPGFDPGVPGYVFEEAYALGAITPMQLRQHAEEKLIAMTIPLKIQGTSEANLQALVAAINALIDAGPQTLVHGPVGYTLSYNCVYSQRPAFPRQELVTSVFSADVTLTLLRTP